MKKMVCLTLLIVIYPALVFAQDKIEAPIWNVGDKWVFTGGGSIEVVKVDQRGYILKLSDANSVFENQGCNTILFDKTTLNRINSMEGDKPKKYEMGLSKVLDFPLSIGKQWKSTYSLLVIHQWSGHRHYYDYVENFKVMAWDDAVMVQAGKFKALKLEYRRKVISGPALGSTDEEVINKYWYSPDTKYFVKCQYDKDWMKQDNKIFNWELTSFQLKNRAYFKGAIFNESPG